MSEARDPKDKRPAGDFKDSVHLPKTDFPMKASLPSREPLQLAKWAEQGIFEKLLAKNQGRERFVMHDGPPYANGHIHQGHILNKTLKDIVVKYANMSGQLADFVPGWDCHGLPIELKTEEELGSRKKDMSKVDIRRACRAYAERFIDIQREEFKRIGVFARWDAPYRTMDKAYEAQTVRELAAFARKGSLVRGKKPVYWCIKDRTALAEAEVEYEDHTSPSSYVAFPLETPLPIDALRDRKAELVIWTTTPWTLPANLAISVHPDVTYVAYDLVGRVLVVARDRLAPFLAEVAPEELLARDIGALPPSHDGESPTPLSTIKDAAKILGTVEGKTLEGLTYTHVLNGRSCPVTLGGHVTTEAGTGLVHTAPGHGAEDYEVGRRYGLSVLAPVDAAGRFTDEAGEFKGQVIWDANPKIIARLAESKALLGDPAATLRHSYAHCWRCKKPVIFRATAQWFISMEANDLRKKSLEAIDRVRWIPRWGRERIAGMIANRPDWCVSRQRVWGVPIPVFYCEAGCEEPLVDAEAMENVARAFEEDGADAWFTREPSTFLAPGTRCVRCGGTRFRKEDDILDVWFESGISYAAVAEKRPNLGVPVDLYLEGSDQHRGWFHSALLCSVGTRGRAPYKAVLTHGFVVDGEGRKMSKSLGNYVPPEKVLKELGAEILRLWVAAADYRDDIRMSPQILEGITEGYRKIRNTLRYCLGNLSDFMPEKDGVKWEALLPIDRWALVRLSQIVERVRRAYDAYEFHTVFHTALDFCAVELSAVYFDIIKDRLYTAGTASPARRAAQTVLHEVLLDLLRLLAPIMSFTCDEAYSHLPHRSAESIFLCGMAEPRVAEGGEALLSVFERLFAVRADAQKLLEAARRDELIGKSLEAQVTVFASGDWGSFLEAHLGELPSILLVSKVVLATAPLARSTKGESTGLELRIDLAPGEKCPRCWTYSEAIDSAKPLCPKCREALAGWAA